MAKRLLLVAAAFGAMVLAGCGSQAAQCQPVPDGVAVCVGGKAVAFQAKTKPHMHEAGGFYAPAEELARALGVQVEIAPDKKSVKVAGKEVKAAAPDAKGIHEHDGLVYVPIKEFAEAAGYKYSANVEQKTVNLTK